MTTHSDRAAVVRQALAGAAVRRTGASPQTCELLTRFVLGYLSRERTNALLHAAGQLVQLPEPVAELA